MAEQKFRIIILAYSFINIAFVTHTTVIPDVHAIIINGPVILAKLGPELFYGSPGAKFISWILLPTITFGK
jgi:hypothetical protein